MSSYFDDPAFRARIERERQEHEAKIKVADAMTDADLLARVETRIPSEDRARHWRHEVRRCEHLAKQVIGG